MTKELSFCVSASKNKGNLINAVNAASSNDR